MVSHQVAELTGLRDLTGWPTGIRLASLFSMVNRGYGRTLLAPDGMQFSTLVSRG
jgi:hypothetical protein